MQYLTSASPTLAIVTVPLSLFVLALIGCPILHLLTDGIEHCPLVGWMFRKEARPVEKSVEEVATERQIRVATETNRYFREKRAAQESTATEALKDRAGKVVLFVSRQPSH